MSDINEKNLPLTEETTAEEVVEVVEEIEETAVEEVVEIVEEIEETTVEEIVEVVEEIEKTTTEDVVEVVETAIDGVEYDDEAIAAEYNARREEQKAIDYEQPYDPKAILEVRHLRKCFPLKKSITGKVLHELVAVDDVSFKLMPGETLGIVGESGCGKTTLGRAILKLHQPTAGKIIFMGQDITDYKSSQMREIRKQMQIIFQDPYSSLPPRDTVGGILSEPVEVHKIVPKEQV
ncbi:MAG: ATP-binding cassette domain-containing protein, partial [Clostridia bacterium]|nr:ATP-binding cassette domain-containing protein [Clostridia bacterium]